MPRLSPLILLWLLLLISCGEDNPPQPPLDLSDARLDRETPEGTHRRFMLGLMTSNEELVRSTIMPVSDNDLRILIKPDGPRLSDSRARDYCLGMKIRRLQVGDSMELSTGEILDIGVKDVDEEHLVQVHDDATVPTLLIKLQNRWRVDATSIIATRRAGGM